MIRARWAWRASRHHLFVLMSLLGCIAPWITPRIFPANSLLKRPPWMAAAIAGTPEVLMPDASSENQLRLEGQIPLYAFPFFAPSELFQRANSQAAGQMGNMDRPLPAPGRASDHANCIVYPARS